MLKERIQEILDFTKSESPYKKANKGWINEDVFLDLSPSASILKQNKEAAKVTLLWAPINNLISNIFLIVVIGSILVFSSVSFVKGSLNFNLFNISDSINLIKVDENITIPNGQLQDKDTIEYEIESNFDEGKSKEIESLDQLKFNEEREFKINQISKPENKSKIIEKTSDAQNLKKKKSKSNLF